MEFCRQKESCAVWTSRRALGKSINTADSLTHISSHVSCKPSTKAQKSSCNSAGPSSRKSTILQRLRRLWCCSLSAVGAPGTGLRQGLQCRPKYTTSNCVMLKQEQAKG